MIFIIQKNAKKIVVKGEEFKIDRWAECEKCHKWRRIGFKLNRSEHFTCKSGGLTCHKKEESSDDYITLPKLKGC